MSVGAMQVCSGLQSSRAGWISFRLLLGATEAGMYSGCTFTLTSWYSSAEIQNHMSLFYSAASLSGAFAGLLAYGLGQLDYAWGYRGWRFIYAVEGLITLALGISVIFFIYPDSANAGKWPSADEKRFLVLRNQYATGGETGVVEKDTFSWKHARLALQSLHVWFIIIIQFMVCTIVYGVSFALPTIIHNFGYSAVNAQAMIVPPYIFVSLHVAGGMARRSIQPAHAFDCHSVDIRCHRLRDDHGECQLYGYGGRNLGRLFHHVRRDVPDYSGGYGLDSHQRRWFHEACCWHCLYGLLHSSRRCECSPFYSPTCVASNFLSLTTYSQRFSDQTSFWAMKLRHRQQRIP